MLIEYEEDKEMITGKCEYCGSPIKSGEKFCHPCADQDGGQIVRSSRRFG